MRCCLYWMAILGCHTRQLRLDTGPVTSSIAARSKGKSLARSWVFRWRMFTNATRLLHIESMDWTWQFCTIPNGVWLHFLPLWIAYIINISTWIALRLSTCHTFPRHTRKGGKEGRVAGDLTYIVWKVHLTFRITCITDQMGKAAIKGPDECGPIVDFVGAFLDVFRRKVVDLEAYLPVTSCQNQTLEHLLNRSKWKRTMFLWK